MSKETRLAETYADGLFFAALDAGSLDTIEPEVDFLADMTQEDAFVSLACDKLKSKALASALFSLKWSDFVMHWLRLVDDYGRWHLLAPMVAKVKSRILSHKKTVVVKAKVAFSLTDARVAALTSALKEQLGAEVSLTIEEDPSLLGGIVLYVDGKVLRYSFSSMMEKFLCN